MSTSSSNTYITAFLEYLQFEKRYSQHTIISYQTDLQQFFDYALTDFETEHPKQITSSMIRSWLAQLKEQNVTAKSINRKISTLKSFYKYQLKQGDILVSPLTNIISQIGRAHV